MPSIVVIGASAGGVSGLLTIARNLPASLPEGKLQSLTPVSHPALSEIKLMPSGVNATWEMPTPLAAMRLISPRPGSQSRIE